MMYGLGREHGQVGLVQYDTAGVGVGLHRGSIGPDPSPTLDVNP